MFGALAGTPVANSQLQMFLPCDEERGMRLSHLLLAASVVLLSLNVAYGQEPGVAGMSSAAAERVTGEPAHLQQAIEGTAAGATPWVGVTPIPPYNGSTYPPGVTLAGNTATLDGSPVRLWFEVQLGGWGGELTTYQIAIDLASLSDGVGADLLRPEEPCAAEEDCYVIFGQHSRCTDQFTKGSFVCTSGFRDYSNPRYAINGLIGPVDTANLLVFGSTVLPFLSAVAASPGELDDGGVYYAGTFVLDAIDAQGTYTIRTLENAATFMVLAGAGEIPIAEFRSAIVHVPEGRCCNLTDQTCLDGVMLGECNDQVGRTRFVEGATCDGVDCIPTDGACCDRRPGSGGVCRLLEEVDCPVDPLVTFTLNTECADVACAEATGACCERVEGTCADRRLLAACTGSTVVWHPDESCSQIACPPDFEVIPAVSDWGLVVLVISLLAVVKVYSLRQGA